MSRNKTVKKDDAFAMRIVKDREQTATSIMDFDFKKARVRILSAAEDVKSNSKGILYWMFRDARLQDNWAMLFAQKLAIKNKVPLFVTFFALPNFLDANSRHYMFLFKGLEEVKNECDKVNISFYLYPGWPYEELPKIVNENEIGAVVCDFFPLRKPLEWVEKVKQALPKDVPLIQVDAHNIVPCWIASNKKEYAARTIRPKINSHLSAYLTPFPPVIKHEYTGELNISNYTWTEALNKCNIDMTVPEVSMKPGYQGAVAMLESFCKKRLKNFATKRNDPCFNALSHMSPWLHFGHIAPQRCVLEVMRYKKEQSANVAAYCEEAIIRRELSDNFCFYVEDYDNFNGATDWAKGTLNAHRKDIREYVYTKHEFESAITHDPLWNSAQIELTTEGKMHGYMRMYWAKKILEWTESPEDAIEIAIYLNDRYSLDGRDPNGYTGIMWSMCGIHDQSWAERNIFGKIRYMNFDGCKRKFKIKDYITRWGGKEFEYTPKKKIKIDDVEETITITE